MQHITNDFCRLWGIQRIRCGFTSYKAVEIDYINSFLNSAIIITRGKYIPMKDTDSCLSITAWSSGLYIVKYLFDVSAYCWSSASNR